MDRPQSEAYRSSRLRKRWGAAAALAVTAAVLIGWAPRLARPSVARTDVRTATVDIGPIEATISAAGTVVPEFEQVLASPLDARVVRILKTPGAALKRGEPILDLEVDDSVLELEKLNQQLELKLNAQKQRKLELDSTLNTLQSQYGLKQIDVKSFELQIAKQEKLREAGLNSLEQLREAQVALERSRIELKQLEQAIRQAERSTEAQLEGLALEIGTVEKERLQSRRKLEMATTKADRDGVLTWVTPEAGAVVKRGDVVARIADLSSFRVQATVSDVHSASLAAGMPVRVKVGETHSLAGEIAEVLPAIKDGIVTVYARLDEKSHDALRANLRVDVFIATERRQRALRVSRGPFAAGSGEHEVFVMREGKALRAKARFGVTSFDHMEVLGGLMEGDQVIVSDMRDYLHARELQIR